MFPFLSRMFSKVTQFLPGSRNVKNINNLRLYNIPKNKCIIFGDAILALHNLKNNQNLEIAVTKNVFNKIKKNKNFEKNISKLDNSVYYISKNNDMIIFDRIFPFKEKPEKILNNPSYINIADGYVFLNPKLEYFRREKIMEFISRNRIKINIDNIIDGYKILKKYLESDNNYENKETVVDFVLQKHLAKIAGEHLDLRIGFPDNRKMLASWAIPRAVIPKPGAKVLAVRTNDHGQKWLNFEGNIESGYGAGVVKIIQKGKAIIHLWSESHIVFEIREGKPFIGKYALIKFGKIKNRNQEAWLLIKMTN